MAGFKAIAQLAPVRATYVQTGAAAAAVDAFIFNNPAGSGEYFEVLKVSAIWEVAGSGGSNTLDIKIVPNGTALASGTSVLAATINQGGTARTATAGVLHATNNKVVGPGQNLAVDLGTVTSLSGLNVVVTLQPVRLPV